MKKTTTKKAKPSAEDIAKLADRGRSVASHFTNRGKMMQPVRQVSR